MYQKVWIEFSCPFGRRMSRHCRNFVGGTVKAIRSLVNVTSIASRRVLAAFLHLVSIKSMSFLSTGKRPNREARPTCTRNTRTDINIKIQTS